MQLIASANDVNIYNLSAGKTVPEWLSAENKRKLEKRSINDMPNRLDLIQDFEMPDVSTSVRMTPDLKYIYVAGTYKPRLCCYDVSQLSIKFERCIDNEIIKMYSLSEDYEKLILLEEDRYVEFHVRHGRYYRTRIPCFGRDLAFHSPTAQVYIAASGPEIYRLSLELGQFMSPLKSDDTSLTCCDFNPYHYLFAAGTEQGKVEAFDPRAPKKVATLDCFAHAPNPLGKVQDGCSVTSIKYRDALNLAVGNSWGQILMYDIRSSRPYLVKDHQYGFPIKCIDFAPSQNLVLSLDTKIVKLWDWDSGAPYCSIEPGVDLNDMALIPDTGLVFMANESQKVQTYFVPSLGPAPKWCSFLDNYTDELQETETPTVYDDYKFVTKEELEALGLANLIGSNLLRAYMHGYFMDVRLYSKAQALANPNTFENFKQKKVKLAMAKERSAATRAAALPKVNKHLAERLMAEKESMQEIKVRGKAKAKAKNAANVLIDNRFGALFENADYQVDEESEQYRLLNPALVKMQGTKERRQEKLLERKFKLMSTDNDEEGFRDDDSDNEEGEQTVTSKKKKKESIKDKNPVQPRPGSSNVDLYELSHGEQFSGWINELVKGKGEQSSHVPLQDRINEEEDDETVEMAGGGMQMSFKVEKKSKGLLRKEKSEAHVKERKKSRRTVDRDIKKSLNKLPFDNVFRYKT